MPLGNMRSTTTKPLIKSIAAREGLNQRFPRALVLAGCLLAAIVTRGAEPAPESLSGGLFTTSVQVTNAFRQTIAFADDKL